MKFFAFLTTLLLLTGCAKYAAEHPDPFENYNRRMTHFNHRVDKFVFKPLANIYAGIVPDPMRRATDNVFSNLDEIPTIANDLLQGKFKNAWSDSQRFLINSTFGIAGMVDLAHKIGFEKHYQDFGLTLANWGHHHSAYFVLPLLGPSTIRDALGLIVDSFFNPVSYIRPSYIPVAIATYRVIHKRADLLDAEQFMDVAALDRYSFMRDAYLQQRSFLIQGNKVADDLYLDDGEEETEHSLS